MSLTTRESFSEKPTSGTWLYPHATRHTEDPLVFYTPGIRGHTPFVSHAPDLLLFKSANSLQIALAASCKHLCWDVPSFVEGFGFFRYWLGVVGHCRWIDQGVFNETFHFVAIVIIWSFQLFHYMIHFFVDSGMASPFDLTVDAIVEKVRVVIFSVNVTVGITNYIQIIIIIFITYYRNCSSFSSSSDPSWLVVTKTHLSTLIYSP